MALTNIKVAQMACIEVGLDPVQTMADDTAEGKAIASHYDNIVENAISIYFWRFAMAQKILVKLGSDPAGRWDAAYQVPSEVFTIRAVTVADSPISFERYDDMVYCNADTTVDVVLDASFDTAESKWPPYFTRLVVLQLAAVLASAVREDAEMRKALDDQSMIQFRLAKSRDGSARTASQLRPTRITNARIRRAGIG